MDMQSPDPEKPASALTLAEQLERARALQASAIERLRAKQTIHPAVAKPPAQHASPQQARQKAQQAAAPQHAPVAIPKRTSKADATPQAAKAKARNLSATNYRGATRLPPPVDLDESEERELIQALLAQSSRPEMLVRYARPVVDAMRAVLAGAAVVGPAGTADRGVLWRLVGLSLAPGTGHGGGGKADARRAVQLFGTEIAGRLARVEQGSGRVPVTIDAEIVGEPRQDNAVTMVTQEMDNLVREAETQAAAPIAAAPSPPPAAPMRKVVRLPGIARG